MSAATLRMTQNTRVGGPLNQRHMAHLHVVPRWWEIRHAMPGSGKSTRDRLVETATIATEARST